VRPILARRCGRLICYHHTPKSGARKPLFSVDNAKRRAHIAPMNTPRTILAYVGHEAASQALGVSMKRLDNAQYQTALPASWYDTLERLAGRPLPREAFAFKGRAA